MSATTKNVSKFAADYSSTLIDEDESTKMIIANSPDIFKSLWRLHGAV